MTNNRINTGLTLLRAAVATIFIAHGGQKLFVYGLSGVTGAFGQMGVPFPEITGPLVALLEFFGGIALLVGLLTRTAALGLAITMVGAMVMVHAPGGFFLPNGIEFTLLLSAASLGFAIMGGGEFSIDALLARRRLQAPRTAPVGRTLHA